MISNQIKLVFGHIWQLTVAANSQMHDTVSTNINVAHLFLLQHDKTKAGFCYRVIFLSSEDWHGFRFWIHSCSLLLPSVSAGMDGPYMCNLWRKSTTLNNLSKKKNTENLLSLWVVLQLFSELQVSMTVTVGRSLRDSLWRAMIWKTTVDQFLL